MNTIFVLLEQKVLLVCGILAAGAMAAGLLGAQSPASRAAARITTEIAGTEQTALQGTLHPFARPQNDAGRLPSDTRINGISLYFNRSAAQQADLDALLAAQQNPASPQYHQWLTPDQFAARFGMVQPDIDKVQSWLQQQGFSVDSVARSRTMIRFSGSVGQVESAFSTQMHYYTVGGVRHFAPSTQLSVPAAIAPVVAGVRNLNDFRPRPQHIKPRSAFTSSQSGAVYFAPPDIATVYDIGPLTSSGVNGAGQTIAIAGQSAIDVTDIENFESASNLAKKDPTMVLVPGTGDSQVVSGGDEGESDIDIEWSGATAPGANIVFVYVGSDTNFGVYDAVSYAIDEKLANIISLSYDTCELGLTTMDITPLENTFQQAASQGQSITVASGDQGSTACFIENPPKSGDPPLTTQEALAVNYPASSAYVTALGGTEIAAADGIDPTTGTKGADFSTYWQGQGSSDIVSSVLKWIPELVWNDDPVGNGLSATGGGASTLIARPSWQTGVPGIPSGSNRLVPDVSLYASQYLPGYLFCTSDQSDWSSGSVTAPPQQASCASGTYRDTVSGAGYLTVAGGTSFAAPIFAGMIALINQKANYPTGQGLINIELYHLAANSSTYASAFHDVTSGNNYCTAGSTDCASNGATLGYKAGTGYDEVTGLGSVDLNALASAWPVNSSSSAALLGTTTGVTASNSTPNTGQSVTFSIAVAAVSGSTNPSSGTINLSIDGGGTPYNSGGTTSSVSVGSSGTATYTTSFSTAGTHEVVAQYAGDSTFAASTGSASIVISTTSSGKGTIALGATPATLTVSQGSSGNETISVTPSGGYTGTVLLNFTTSNDSALANLCYSFTTMDNNNNGTLAVNGTAAVSTQLNLDTNAADCSSSTGAAKPGMHPLRNLLKKNASRGPAPKPVPNRLPAEAALGALLLGGIFRRYGRKFRAAAWVLILAAAGLALTACGSSVSSSLTDPSKGTYTINMTGTDSTTSTITGKTTFTLTID